GGGRMGVEEVGGLVGGVEPRIRTAGGEIRFQEVDDFHPDRLFHRLDVFARLREARATTPGADDDQLSRLLGGPAPRDAARATSPATGLDALIRDAVAPHVVKDTSATAAAHRAATDAAIAHEMRALLHDPAFQQLEAAWRGVSWLISGIELDDTLQLHLFDVSRDEMLADLIAAQGKISESGLYRAVAERVPGDGGWSAIACPFRFGPSNADIALLAALGLIASKAGGPLIADADLALAGDAESLTAWRSLRRTEAARWIALAAPRLLLRIPYGAGTDPVEAFGFEEVAGAPANDELLWGSAALAVALTIGRAFTARGWDMEPGDEREIGDLPAYTFTRDGEREMQPCAERLLTYPAVDLFLRSGLAPI